jgi:ABC-type multidrug transport system fused ATPase/permease subunit
MSASRRGTASGLPGRVTLARWLLHHTRDLLRPLALAIVLRIVGQLVGVALLVVAVDGVLRAVGLADTGYGSDPAAGAGAGAGTTALGAGGVLSSTIVWLVVLALVKAVLRYLEQYSGHYVAFAALASLRRLFFARLAPQAPAATEGASSGDLSARATRDIDRVEVFFAHTVPPAVSAVVVPVVAIAWTALAVDPVLALVMLPVPVLVVAVIPFLSGASTWGATRARGAATGRIAGHVSESVGGVREILAFEHAPARLAELDALGREASRAASRVSTVAGLRAGLVQAVQLAGIVAVLVVGSARSLDGLLGPSVTAGAGSGIGDGVGHGVDGVGAVAIAIAVFLGIAGPTRAVDGFVADLDASFASAARLFEVLEREPVVTDSVVSGGGARAVAADNAVSDTVVTDNVVTDNVVTDSVVSDTAAHASLSGAPSTGSSAAARGTTPAVRFDLVSFAYPDTADAAVSDVSWSVQRGSHVAIVGVSGSGKSTLTSLLARTWDPTTGSVRLDGADLRLLPLAEVRSRVAIVNQRPFVFARSLRENLVLGAPDATDDEIAAALRTAALDPFVASLPEGLDTGLRDRGARLSGGQLQRLALARAIVTAPDVLVLDESTGALDPATESTVRARLAEWAGGHRTIVEVTHRVDQVLGVDRVLVLDRGRVVEEGDPQTLAAARGPFAALLARV